jgi:carbon monoxide dehydrogenase subunit G
MRLEQSFEVAAPVERVWEALIDVEKVAPCLPGASVSGRNEDESYDGAFTVKVGPTSASYAGKLMMQQVDEDTHTAKMQANGTDKRGQGSAKATIVSTVSAAAENRTRVEVVTDYHITGRLARFGRGGMIEDISERLLREFAQRLQRMLEGPGDGAPADAGGPGAGESPPEPRSLTPIEAQPVPSEPLEALSLVGSVLWERARRRPAPFAFIAGLLLAVMLLGRRRRH